MIEIHQQEFGLELGINHQPCDLKQNLTGSLTHDFKGQQLSKINSLPK